MIKHVHSFDSAYRALNRNFNAVFIVDNVAYSLTGDAAKDRDRVSGSFDSFYHHASGYGIDRETAHAVYVAMVNATREAIEYSRSHRGI